MKLADPKKLAAIALPLMVFGALAAWLLPSYWIYLSTAVLISAIALQSLGLVSGRVGMISLCQMSFAGVGAWTVGYLNVAEFPGGLTVWVLIGGLAAVPFGIAIGLPALRLRGINLAIVTLGFAAAFDSVLSTITYPGQTSFLQVPRPETFDSDRGYFIYVLIFFAVLALLLDMLARTRLGAAWLAIRHSERAAGGHGVSIPNAKLSAFAISAFIAGISGGLLAGYLGTLVAANFSMMNSLALFVVATMAGALLTEGTIIGGLLITMVPELLRSFGLTQDIGQVLFALGATQALSTGETMAEALRRQVTKRLPAGTGTMRSSHEPPAPRQHPREGLMLETSNLTVRYGAVVALDSVDLKVPAGAVVGLIGPNGAGKSTFVDAVTGFLQSYEGSVRLCGRPINTMQAHLRARSGVRRTWQTTRIATDLTVGQYIRLAAGTLDQNEVEGILQFFDCPAPETPIARVDAGTRRLLDVAGVVAARPPLVLLDEPAAGQSYDEALKLGRRIAEIPVRFGSSVLLIEHDMDLVRTACSEVTVLDFGQVIAHGAPNDVLDRPAVRKAYLGIDEEEKAA